MYIDLKNCLKKNGGEKHLRKCNRLKNIAVSSSGYVTIFRSSTREIAHAHLQDWIKKILNVFQFLGFDDTRNSLLESFFYSISPRLSRQVFRVWNLPVILTKMRNKFHFDIYYFRNDLTSLLSSIISSIAAQMRRTFK